MNDSARYQELSDEQLMVIHKICESFEDDLQEQNSGVNHETIAEKLLAVDDTLKRSLFEELLAIEIEFKHNQIDSNQLDSYRKCFPDYTEEIQRVVSQLQALDSGSSTSPNPQDRSRREAYRPGSIIASGYQLVRKVGEGGMGQVWLAQQSIPVQRQVAIKLVKMGMDSSAMLARFELEKQALARMNHPNIAHVFDAGMTTLGQPFFVMEWVSGLPLNRYCDEKCLAIMQRLELFVTICTAVQHAHQKGIVHRDLKPSNIIVTTENGVAVPKVIDFGVAKSMEEQLCDSSVVTQMGVFLGTLAYMSPEQAGAPNGDVDTQSDIYTLGVVLYELLTGLRPIDAQRLNSLGLAAMIKVIQEEDPSRPSTRLSSNPSLSEMASVRSIDPNRFAATLRGELDWIVMKCLEKDRERRYATANTLALDIGRYLVDQPIEARPPSTGYKVAKFFSRNKGLVAAVSTMVLLLLGGIAGTGFGLVRAENARVDAVNAQWAESQRAESEKEARLEATKQKELAIAAAEEERLSKLSAETRLQQIERSNVILSDIFASLNPEAIALSNRPLQEVLIEKLVLAAKQLEGDSIGDPLIVASMQLRLAESLSGLSANGAAADLSVRASNTFRRLLGAEDPSTIQALTCQASYYVGDSRFDLGIETLNEVIRLRNAKNAVSALEDFNMEILLGVALHGKGEIEKAIPIIEVAVADITELLGDDDPETLSNKGILAEIYRKIGRPALAVEQLEAVYNSLKSSAGSNHPETLLVMVNFANALQNIGNLDESMTMYQNAFRRMKKILGRDHSLTLKTMGMLASLYKDIGDTDSAIALLEERMERMTLEVGVSDPNAARTMSDLSSAYLAAGQTDRAMELCKRAVEVMKKAEGPDHPDTLTVINTLAMIYQVKGDLETAKQMLEDNLESMRLKLRRNHPDTLTCLENLSGVYQDMGMVKESFPLLEEVISLERAILGAQHPNTLRTMNNLAVGYWMDKQLDKSIPIFEELVKQATALFGPKHPNTLMTMMNLGVNLKDSDDLEKARPLLERTYKDGKSIPQVVSQAGPHLLDVYAKLGDKDAAVEMSKKHLDLMRTQFAVDGSAYAELQYSVATILIKVAAYAEAESVLQSCLSYKDVQQPDEWETFRIRGLLGRVFFELGKNDRAQPLIESGYNGMLKHEEMIPADSKMFLQEMKEDLIRFYKATQQQDKADQFLD